MVFNWRKFPWTNLHDLNLDWIIQTVKMLEENLAAYVNTVDSKLNTEISNRKAGDAAIQTAIEHEIKPELATETENRKSGDAALRSTINNVIIPRLDSISAASNSYVLLVTGTESTESNIALTSEQVTALQNAAQNNYPITMILRDGDYYTAYYPIVIESTSMMFGKVCNFNSLSGAVDVNQAIGRMVVASITIMDNAGTMSFVEFPSGLTRFLPLSLSIRWSQNANSYTLTDKEYAILRQSLLDKRQIFIVRNTADTGGEQTTYSLLTCATPSTLNVDNMTLVLQGPSNNSITVQMASKTIVHNNQ